MEISFRQAREREVKGFFTINFIILTFHLYPITHLVASVKDSVLSFMFARISFLP